MNKTLNDIIIISKINLLSLRESLVPFTVVSLIIPLGMTYLISLSSPNWDLNTKINYLTGMLVLSSSLTVLNGVGQYIAQDRLKGIISWYRTSPVNPISYILGITTTYIISIIVESLILIPIASVLWNIKLNFLFIGFIILIVVILGFSLIGIGAIIGTRSKNIQSASSLTNLISFIIAFVTPAYYSISIIPEKLQILLYVLPTTEASLIIKDLYAYGGIDLLYFIILLIITIPYLFIGFIGIKWREK